MTTKPLTVRTEDGRAVFANSKRDSAKLNLISHDWTDKTTWYTNSVYVPAAVAVDSGDHLTYSLLNGYLIDTYHSKLFQEDTLGKRVVVKVNGVAKIEEDPHYGESHGDYTINYASGSITFKVARSLLDVVTADYWYATDSAFYIRPSEGKKVNIESVECQFSEDVIMTDSAVFQPYGFVEYFAPQYCTTNGGPYPPGTKIPLGAPLKYKSITDIQAEAIKGYPAYPAMGGNGWRGVPMKINIVNWDYLTATALMSSMGMEIKVYLEHDAPFGGWFATTTFYCSSDSE